VAFVFDGLVAINPDTNLPEPNGAGQVYALADESLTTPLTVTDLSGAPMTGVNSGPLGLVQTFVHPTEARVQWVSGGVRVVLSSLDGLIAAVAAAQGAALASSQAAAQASADLQTYITTYPGSGRVIEDGTVAELIVDEDSATHAAVISVAGAAGGGDALASDLYAVRKRTSGGSGPWEPANRGNFAGIMWVGVDPSSVEQLPGDIRYVPVDG